MANLLTCDAVTAQSDGRKLNLVGLGTSHNGELCVVIELDEDDVALLHEGAALSLHAEGYGAEGFKHLLLHEFSTVPRSGDAGGRVIWRRKMPSGVWRMTARIDDQEAAHRMIDHGA